MFSKQIENLKRTIDLTTAMYDYEAAITEFTKILTQPLKTKSAVSIRAILFLEKDDQADVYYRRAYAFEMLAKQAFRQNDHKQALMYFRRSSSDTYIASKLYEDANKKAECRKNLREDKEAMDSIRKKMQEPAENSLVSSTKRVAFSPDNTHTSSQTDTPPIYNNLRKRGRMWNPKQQYEDRVDVLELERLGPSTKRRG